jgi:hypothetical protein
VGGLDGDKIVDKDYIGPPENNIRKILEGLNLPCKKKITGKMKQYCK